MAMNAQAIQAQPLNPQSQGVIVYGLQIQNPELARLTRRVLLISSISAGFVILGVVLPFALQVWSAGQAGIGGAIVAILCGLLVPCCGYFGAKNNDQNLTCCFCGCNLLGAICSLANIAMFAFMFVGLQKLVDSCDPGFETSTGCPSGDEWAKLCPNDTPRDCYSDLKDSAGKLEAALAIIIIVRILGMILYCFGFCWGNKLYQELKTGTVIVSGPAQFATHARAVQPATQ